ncbi:glycoside hydrolase family 15 protein [Microlunatus sagamiharensis]|uniref:hypothetical protein n=1 Tax=Microlunatus sagamiharensis TaxID=546874 RepID=UPI000B87BD27|nr:hypothetical protein [Microlunatus sagamiharensis]
MIFAAMIPLAVRFHNQANVALHDETVAIGPGGQTIFVTDASRLVPGYRVTVDNEDAAAAVREQQAWLDRGTIPSAASVPSPDLARLALLDLHVLSRDHNVAVAGWSPKWRYVWPRDLAFVASAFSRTGHYDDAVSGLAFLQRVQPNDGVFMARYLPDGSGVPDARGPQLDGSGWSLWAIGQVLQEAPSAEVRRATAAQFRPMLDRSTQATLAAVRTSNGLPPSTSDYWEVKPAGTTLATSAVLLAGLRNSAYAYSVLADPDRSQEAADAANKLQAAIAEGFGPDGYPRYLGGSHTSVDLGVSFLLPPFGNDTDPEALTSWRRAPRYMHRPAGGLAPGGSWRRDGISWTPTVGTVAVTAACVDPPTAATWLTWIASHRTSAGSIPEKVLDDGQPASVTPLGWSAASVVIALDELSHGCNSIKSD